MLNISRCYPSAFNVYQNEDRSRSPASSSTCRCLLLCYRRRCDLETVWQSSPYQGTPCSATSPPAEAARGSESWAALVAQQSQEGLTEKPGAPKAAAPHAGPSHPPQQQQLLPDWGATWPPKPQLPQQLSSTSSGKVQQTRKMQPKGPRSWITIH